MWVIKIGGSLQNAGNLPGFLNALVEFAAGSAVIVPGGGVFADQVREQQMQTRLDDVAAHRMALCAMEKFGALLISYAPALQAASSLAEITELLSRRKIPVWFPYNMVADHPSIHPGWDVTSDSLSLWLAEQLQCRHLFVLKATSPVTENYSAQYLSQHGLLDGAYFDMLRKSKVMCWWLDYQQATSFFHMLEMRDHPATVMKEITTFNQYLSPGHVSTG